VGDKKEFALRNTQYQLEVLELDEVGVRVRLTELGTVNEKKELGASCSRP
jgi:hypothetical protein